VFTEDRVRGRGDARNRHKFQEGGRGRTNAKEIKTNRSSHQDTAVSLSFRKLWGRKAEMASIPEPEGILRNFSQAFCKTAKGEASTVLRSNRISVGDEDNHEI
jgi:hypothetical protein